MLFLEDPNALKRSHEADFDRLSGVWHLLGKEVATVPEVWMLGTSDYGAQIAAHFGIPYCFAHFITDGQGVARALALYRENYRPSARFPEPVTSVCVWALAADTAAEAERLYQSRAYSKVRRRGGALGPIDPPDDVDWSICTPAEIDYRDRLRAEALIGDGAAVAAHLTALADSYAVDEMAVLTWTHDQAARRRSYTLLAEHMALSA